MSGLPEMNYPAFVDAERRLVEHGFTVLNPIANESLREANDAQRWATWSWYMRQSLKQIAETDHIAVLPGWQDSVGARLEVQIARALGMIVRPLDDWLAGVESDSLEPVAHE